MVRCAIVIAILCCTSILLHATPALATVPVGYNLVYDENFNGTSIVDTKFGYQWTGYPGVYATAEGVSVSGGAVTLTTYTTNTGGTLTNWGACVASEGYSHTWNGPPINYQYTYGYFEGRIKITNAIANNPAFWLESDRMFDNPAPTTAAPGNEVDIIEHNHRETNTVHTAIHWGGYGASHQSYQATSTVAGLEGSFHTFGLLWTPTAYRIYVDDVLKLTITDPAKMSYGPEFLVLSTGSNNWGGNWWDSPPAGGYGSLETSTTKMVVDYVRVYQLPVTWTAGSGSWSTGGNWTFAGSAGTAPNSSLSIAMTNGGTISLSGGSQSVLAAGAAGSGLVGTLTNGSLTFACDFYMKSGTLNVDLSNAGIASHLWIGGDAAATVHLGGNNNTTCVSDFTYGNAATIIGHTSVTGAAGTVKLTTATALNASGQTTDVYNGTLDLNGQTGVRSAQIRLLSGGSSSLVNGNTSAAASYTGIVDMGGGTPNLGGDGNLTLSGTLQNGGLVKIGAGVLTLSGAVTYTGDTTVSAGTLKLGAANIIPDGSGKGNVSLAGTLDLGSRSETINGLSGNGTVDNTINGLPTLTVGGNNATSSFSGVIRNTIGMLSLTKTGSGTLTLAGANTYTGATTISAGVLQLGDGTSNGSIAGASIMNNATLLFNNAAALTHGGVINGSGAVLKNGAGTLTLKGANAYTGATSFQAGAAGVLNIQNSRALGTAAAGTTIIANTTLQLEPNPVSGPLYVVAEALSITGTGYNGLGALENLSGNNIWTGTITLAGPAQINSDSDLLTLSGNLVNAANRLTVGGAGNTLISGVISPAGTAGGLTKLGPGTLTLTGANAYTGLTTVEAGTLELGVNARSPVLALGGGANVAGGRLVFDYAGASILSTIQAAVATGVIHRPSANPPLVCLDNLSNAITVLSTVYGDADINGTVNGADLNTVLSNYNQTGMDWVQGDFDNNGTVNGSDLNTVLSNYNQSAGSAAAAVPEPLAIVLLGAVCLAGLAWRGPRRLTLAVKKVQGFVKKG